VAARGRDDGPHQSCKKTPLNQHRSTDLRIALLCGALDYGGSEKQLVYMARVLRDVGVRVHVYSLAGGRYKQAVEEARVPLSIVPQGRPITRLIDIIGSLNRFKPHFVQSTHAFANLYAALGARAVGAVGIGALRSDLAHCLESNGWWTRWLIRTPSALFVNSKRAFNDVISGSAVHHKIYLIPNAVETLTSADTGIRASGYVTVAFVGRLTAGKRADLFLRALRDARAMVPQLRGVIVGDGPEGAVLRERAQHLGLLPDHIRFLGWRADVNTILRDCDMLALTSDHEATPNVILEAMAASLPVIATPAGDAMELVRDGSRGFIVPFDDVQVLAERLRRLSLDAGLRSDLGRAGREFVEREHSPGRLRNVLLDAYRDLAPAALKPRLVELRSCG
jgi:glycosyltransferase involved in cell wall biosynthesis